MDVDPTCRRVAVMEKGLLRRDAIVGIGNNDLELCVSRCDGEQTSNGDDGRWKFMTSKWWKAGEQVDRALNSVTPPADE